MNIQIFGVKKNADTRKAERFFKERGIRYQFIDLKEKGLSKGELASVMQAVGGFDNLLDEKTKDQDAAALIRYLAPEDKAAKILEHPLVIRQPIVRNGKQATVVEKGYRDPRLATARQYAQNGYYIKKGEHGIICEKWIFEKQKRKKDENGNPRLETADL